MPRIGHASLVFFVGFTFLPAGLLYANPMNQYVQKVNFACGTNIQVEYDRDSLKKHNKDIGYGQTDGANNCNEPLRYMWNACKAAAGKTSVQKLGLSKIVCKGTGAAKGKLSRSSGVLTVERAFEEKNAYVRTLAEFKAATGVSVSLKESDPYYDQEWQDLKFKDNPVTDTKNYCMLDQEKKAFEENSGLYSHYEHQKKTGTVKCVKNGNAVVDLRFVNGRKSGLATYWRGDSYWFETYKDHKRDGLAEAFDKGKKTSTSFFRADDQVWRKEYYPTGRLSSYDLKLPDNKGYGRISFYEDGKVKDVECRPEVKGDPILEKVCGFGKPSTIKTFGHDGKLKNTLTFQNGQIASRAIGKSESADRSEVKFVNGKKHGIEKILDKDGKLAGTLAWANGLREGTETRFHTDGKKVVKEIIWKNDKMIEQTEFYLNGHPKRRETTRPDKKIYIIDYHDNGNVAFEGAFVNCQQRYGSWRFNDSCRDGIHKSFRENGSRQEEETFKEGKRSGPSKSWYANGTLAVSAEYRDGKIRSSKYYDESGKLKEAAEYEDDGSRKVTKKK